MPDSIPVEVVEASRGKIPRRQLWVLIGLIVAAQAFLSFLQIGDDLVRGHNGWNTAAYQLSARNSLRWDLIFPLQYDTGTTAPARTVVYTHAPLALHLNTTASVWLFGDNPAATRLPSVMYGVLLVLMLFAFVRRFYGDHEALCAAAIYVCLPINAIYLNMVNHSAGCIFWCFVTVFAYLHYREARYAEGADALRSGRRWLALTFGACAMALSWAWYANYVALGVAIHWFFSSIRRRGGAGRWWFPPGRDAIPLVAWCIFVPGLMVAHFALVAWVTGGIDELLHTVEARADVTWAQFTVHLNRVPGIVFGWPTLALALAWLVSWPWRLLRGRASGRDIVPVMFGLGGAVHYVIFKSSAIVHSYWAWSLLPFVAIALATMVVGSGARLKALALSRGFGARGAAAAACMASLLLVPLASRSIELVPAARSVGGSLWFVAPVRGPVYEVYDSGRAELQFAERVRDWTDRETGVLVHQSIENTRPEPRFYTVLDREHRRVHAPPRTPPVSDRVPAGWVFIAASDAFPHEVWLSLARQYPFVQYGRYVMVDLRRDESEVQIWDLQEAPFDPLWWYFVTPFEPERVAIRQPEAEATMREQLAQDR